MHFEKRNHFIVDNMKFILSNEHIARMPILDGLDRISQYRLLAAL